MRVAAAAQFRDAQLNGAGSALPVALAVAIALVEPALAALAMGGAGQAAHLQRHQPLGGKADHLAQRVGVGRLLEQPAQGHHVVGHRGGLQVQVEGLSNPTLPRISAVNARGAPPGASLRAPCSADPTPPPGTRPVHEQGQDLCATAAPIAKHENLRGQALKHS